jgi:hypothetical protein
MPLLKLDSRYPAVNEMSSPPMSWGASANVARIDGVATPSRPSGSLSDRSPKWGCPLAGR